MDRRERIRRQIAEYRRQLAEGIASDRAVEYLREIRRLETELAKIEVDSDRRE